MLEKTTAITYVDEVRAFFRFLDRQRWLHPDLSYERMKDGLRELIGRVNYKTPRVDDAVALVVTTENAFPLPAADAQNQQLRLELLRDRALISTLYATGMRRQELSSLNRADIQDGRSFEGLITGKGDKEGVVFFDEEALAAIRAYLVVRADTYQPVFLGHGDGRGKPGPRSTGGYRPSRYGGVKKCGELAGVVVTTHHLCHLKA